MFFINFFIEEYLQVLRYSHSVHSGQAQPLQQLGYMVFRRDNLTSQPECPSE